MPGPRGKGKSKSKAKATPRPGLSMESDPFVGNVDSVEGWNAIVAMFCDHLNLPDLTTRNGLKKIHRDFDGIYRRLDRLYDKNATNEKIVGGVIGIYAKMCADSILRDKLFKAGFLTRLMPLLDMPMCLHLALRALSNVTHHGGKEARAEIARHTPVLVKVIEDHPDDAKAAELVVATMSHAVDAVTGSSEDHPDQKLLRNLDISSILKLFVEAMHRPDASRYLINHALAFFAGSTLHCYKECKAYTPVLTCLVASLRSKDLTTRCASLGGLIRLHHHEAEAEPRHYDPQKAIAACQRGYPDHLVDILMNYGFTRGDVVVTLKTTADNQEAFMKCARDRDLYCLGLSLAQFILRTEFSVAKGTFQSQNPRTGAMENMDIGLPFTWWDDALPFCANAIRERGKANEEDLADILDIKYFISKGRIPDAIAHAKSAIARNPSNAYFYYAITLGKDGTAGLRAAKKGLKCKKTTPFVRFALLHRAVVHAGDMGIILLQTAVVGDNKWEEGVAFLTSAMDDAKMYVEEAPPDSRHMKNVLYWYILLTLAINGPEISEDLRELQDTLMKLKFADDFSIFIGNTPPRTELRLAQQTVVSLYAAAVNEWGDVIVRFDNLTTKEEPSISPEKAEDDLAAWLDDMDGGRHEAHTETFSHPVLNNDHVALYRCSWCGNPSAVLRKCSGCEKTRYCDSGCQKSHWGDHKTICKTAASSATTASRKGGLVGSSSAAAASSSTPSASATSAQVVQPSGSGYSLAQLD